MHSVLFIQEILLNIFDHYSPTGPHDKSSANLVVLARTCRTFREPALDVLWRELFGLSPLVRCLPEARKFDGRHYSFSRSLSEAEWGILRGYTRRVRSMSQYFRVRDDRIIQFLGSFTDPLFPNLRSLCWEDVETLPVVHTAVPSLTSLFLGLEFIRGVSIQADLLDTLGERCPNIRQFEVFPSDDGVLHARISRQLCRWKSLRNVNCRKVTLTMDFILNLPSLPILKRFSFTLSADLGNHTAYRGSAFVLSDLADLKIHSTSLKSITAFFSRIQLPRIKDLSVSVSEYTPRRDMQEYWTAVQKACPSKNLSRLAFFSSRDGIENLANLDEERLTLHDLLPYKNFGSLRGIDMNVAWSVNLSDADLLDLVSTSPQLEELSINTSWGWRMDSEGGITLGGLMQLLRQCPSLQNASLVIDTRTFTQIPRGLDMPFLSRRRLRFLNCLDSRFPPEFDPNMRSVFTALRLSIRPPYIA